MSYSHYFPLNVVYMNIGTAKEKGSSYTGISPSKDLQINSQKMIQPDFQKTFTHALHECDELTEYP